MMGLRSRFSLFFCSPGHEMWNLYLIFSLQSMYSKVCTSSRSVAYFGKSSQTRREKIWCLVIPAYEIRLESLAQAKKKNRTECPSVALSETGHGI